MLARKLFWTGLLVLAYAAITAGGDYAVNNLFLHNPAGYTPLEAVLLALVIGAPASFYVLGQRMDVRQAIAARALAEATLREKAGELAASEQRYRLLTEVSPDVVVRTDEQDRIVYVSPSVARFGYRPQDIVGRPAAALVHPDDATAWAPLSQRHDGAQPPPSAGRYRAADGSYRWMETSAVRVDDPASGGRHTITYMRDVTGHVSLESELRRKQAEAEAASRAKSEFLANMSHEIRTPLTGVVGFAGLLETMPELPAEARRYAERIATSAETLVTVVNDILDFSKLEAGQIELDPHAFDPAELIASTSDLVRDRAARKHLALEARAEGPLPPRLIGDSARLRQVLLNLVTNAVKFTETGAVSVTATYDAGAGRLKVSVRDTGVGVAPELADRLFKRFSQVDASSSRAFGGTGLGLAISKSLVEMMGGEIGARSTPGVGSTFWFEAPAAIAPADEATAAETPAQDAALGRLRLLLVDDVAANRELVSVMLSPFEVDLVEVDSGPAAVKAAMGARFDLILMDLQMPGMDGMAAARSIHANSDANRATPVVAISANVLPDQVADAKAAGMVDHIGKPIDPGELITKIARWTEAGAPVEVG